jgi:GTP-binding protein
LQRKLKFLDFAKFHFVSARENIGLESIFKSVDAAFAAAMSKMTTPRLTRVLADAVAKQAPPKHGLFRPKPRYAHQGGSNPPIIVVHGNAVDHIGDSYRRFLENVFREAFKLHGTPLRIQFVTSNNPFADKDKK